MKRWIAWAFASALGMACLTPAYALFYDEFLDGASIQPSDELEQRIWQEAEVSRSQFVRGTPSPQALALADQSRQLIKQLWPDMADKIHVDVIDNADVLALSSANGDIILSTGLFLRIDNDEELAAVLAREIGHVVKRHAVRSVYAARLGAGANTMFQAAVNASSFMGTLSVISSFQVAPEMLLADGGKAFIQTQLSKIRENMADNFIRRVSATGFEAMVKTSLFGYSESLEVESDDYALKALDRAYGNTEAFKRVMQRLADEAAADEKKFSAFYGNEVRMRARLASQADFHGGKLPVTAVAAAAPASASSSATSVNGPAQGELLAPDAIVVEASHPVVAVVVGDEGGDDSEGERPLGLLATEEKLTYPQLVAQIAIPTLQSELEAGHLGRLAKNIQRSRNGIELPDQAQLILAEGLWDMPDPQQAARGEAIARQYIAAHPADARGLKLVGLIYLKRGDMAQAESYLKQAAQAATSDDERGFIEQYLHQAQKKVALKS
ncbi:MAG: M48 family metalloprotease [Burkholderiales bacterium]|nr:M48 family metalloprotease [Burkholderiales bacterium]